MSNSKSEFEQASLLESNAGESDSSNCDSKGSSEESDSYNSDFEDSSKDKAVDFKDVSNIKPNRHGFPFVATPGSTFLLEDKFDVLAYFKLFFDDSVLDILVSETNRYSAQQQSKSDSQWKHVDKNEMMIFLAINILKGLIKKPLEKAYWSTSEIWFTPIFPKLMSLRRYKSIKKNLHFSNNETFDQNIHPNPILFQIWPIYQIINNKCSSLYRPAQDIMIGESVMLYKGPLDCLKYIPIKRLSFGIKLYLLCESLSGYLFSFIIYTGNGTVITGKYKDMPVSCQMVASLLEPLLDKGYCLTIDKNYQSPELESFLQSHTTDANWTEKKNRRDAPKFIGIRKMENCEKVVTDQNETPGGVDPPDQHLPEHPIARKRKIYYKKIFFHLLDISIWNAYILYKKNGGEYENLEFRSELVERLIENYHTQTDKKKSSRPKSCGILRLTERHFPSFVPPTPKKEAPTRYCAVCCAKRDSNGKRKRKESRYMCNNCNVGLCAAPCFEIYHTKKDFISNL